MKNHVQRGDTLTIPAPRDLVGGDGALVGSIFGVSNGEALTGEPADLDVVGVFTLPKVSALAIAIGDVIYWDNSTHLVNKTSSGNTKIGVATTVAANPSASVNVRLNGAF